MEDTFKEAKCEDACQECNCLADSEDALLDLEKMTAEEKKEYLNELFRNRSFPLAAEDKNKTAVRRKNFSPQSSQRTQRKD